MTLYLFSITSFRIFLCIFSQRDKTVTITTFFHPLRCLMRDVFFFWCVSQLNQCYFCHHPAADIQFAYVCMRTYIRMPQTVCESLLHWLSVLRDKSGGKSPFFLFQDHYLSFQSQRRTQGRRRRSRGGTVRAEVYMTLSCMMHMRRVGGVI